MFDSKKRTPVGHTIIKSSFRPLRFPIWVSSFASLIVIVANTGCTVEFSHGCRRCCCQHVCAKTNHVSDQFSDLKYAVPQAGTIPISAPLAKPAAQVPPAKAKSVLHQPKPVQTIKQPESKAEVVVPDNNLSNLSPKEIDELVNDLFENSQRKASGLTVLPVGENIEFEDPFSDLADELNTDQEETAEPDDLDTGEAETLQLDLSTTPDESAMIVAQLPSTPNSRPLRIAQLCNTDDLSFERYEQELQSTAADQSAFSLDPVTRLRAIPVDKWNQRHAGVPISENRTKHPRSQFSFVPDSCNSLLVMPTRSPRSITPGTLLESMDVGIFSERLPVESDSMESQSSLPKTDEVIR